MDEELNKDNILEQEKSFEKEKKRKKLKKILIPTIIILAIAIFFIVLIIILKFQIGNYKEEFDGTIYAKYIIRKDNKKLNISPTFELQSEISKCKYIMLQDNLLNQIENNKKTYIKRRG